MVESEVNEGETKVQQQQQDNITPSEISGKRPRDESFDADQEKQPKKARIDESLKDEEQLDSNLPQMNGVAHDVSETNGDIMQVDGENGAEDKKKEGSVQKTSETIGDDINKEKVDEKINDIAEKETDETKKDVQDEGNKSERNQQHDINDDKQRDDKSDAEKSTDVVMKDVESTKDTDDNASESKKDDEVDASKDQKKYKQRNVKKIESL